MFTVGCGELNNARELNKKELCPNCLKRLPVKDSNPPMLSFVNCPDCGKTYLVGVKGKRVNMIKPERKEKIVPKKYDKIKRRCCIFWCAKAKANVCCRFCPLVSKCEVKCYNDNKKCNCIGTEITGRSKINVVGEYEK